LNTYTESKNGIRRTNGFNGWQTDYRKEIEEQKKALIKFTATGAVEITGATSVSAPHSEP
jgi:hypothetical protein